MFEKYLIGLGLRGEPFKARKPIGVTHRDSSPSWRSRCSSLSLRRRLKLLRLRCFYPIPLVSARIFERRATSISRRPWRWVRRDCAAQPLNSPTWKSHSSVKRTELVHVAADLHSVIHRVPASQHQHFVCFFASVRTYRSSFFFCFTAATRTRHFSLKVRR